MFRDWQNPNKRNQDQLSQNSALQPTLGVPFQRRNGLVQQVPSAETQKSASGNAVASGSGITIWTAGAGNVLYLVTLVVSSQTTGDHQLLYNAVVIAGFDLTANQPLAIPLGAFGVYLYPAAAALTFVNQTGAAANLRAFAWGAEVVA